MSEGKFKLGESKLGGLPDLPAGIEWKNLLYTDDSSNKQVQLSFVLQLNFSEIKPFDLDDLLPESGLLYFFGLHGDAYVNDINLSKGHKIFYAEDTTSFIKQYPLKASSQNPPPFNRAQVFSACKLNFSHDLSLPSFSLLAELHGDEVIRPLFDKNRTYTKYLDLMGHRYRDYMAILGYGGAQYQPDEWFAAGPNCPVQLLFVLPSVNGLNWRNCEGTLMAKIFRDALKEKNFNQVWIDEDF